LLSSADDGFVAVAEPNQNIMKAAWIPELSEDIQCGFFVFNFVFRSV